MKKLLVLMMVLGMASMANATLQISVGGDDNIGRIGGDLPGHLQIDLLGIDELERSGNAPDRNRNASQSEWQWNG